MPFMAQTSMPSSLPEPQPARAADAAATTPAAAPSTNPHPTGTRPQSHSRRSRSRHRRRAPAGHSPPHGPTTLQAIAPQPHLPPLTLPPAQVLPTTLPRTQDHGSTSSLASPHLPRFHFLAHFRMGHRQVSKVLPNRGDTHRRATAQAAGASTTTAPATQATGAVRASDSPGHSSNLGNNRTPHPAATRPAPAAAYPTPPCTSPTLPPAPLR